MIWPQTPKRLTVRQLVLHQLRHARVKVEVPLRQGNVDVTRLADRLAVVERFQNREEAAVLLQQPRECIEVSGAPVAAQCFPFRLGFAGGLGRGMLYIRLRVSPGLPVARHVRRLAGLLGRRKHP